jgi:hypothetical protein
MPESFDPYRKWLGIPPKDQPPHHYRLLGIATFEDDPDVIENAATRQMAHVRTFQSSKQHGPVSQRILTELSAAKVCLLTPERKAEYDARLRARLAAAGQLSSTDLSAAVAAAEEAAEAIPEPELPPLRATNEIRWRMGAEPPTESEPPPVPIPMPPIMTGTAVAPAATFARPTPAAGFPALRGSSPTSAAARTYRKRSSALPIAIFVGSLLALVALGAVAVVVINRQNEQAEGPPKTRPPVPSAGDAAGKAPAEKPTPNKPAGVTPPVSGSAPSTGSGSHAATFPKPTVPLVPTATSLPASENDPSSLRDKMQQAIYLSEQALANRQSDEFQKHIAVAEPLAANAKLPDQGKFRETVEDLHSLQQLNDEFWTIVKTNLQSKLELGERIEFHHHKFELLAREGETAEYFLDDQKRSAEIKQMEPWAAMLIVSKTIKWEDPVTFLPIAAFLSVDAKVTDDSERRFGKQLFAIGRLIGKSNPAIARKLGVRDPNEEIKLDEDLAGKVPGAK